VDQIRLDVRGWRNSGKLVVSRQSYTVRPDYSLKYSVDSTIMNDVPMENGEEEIWESENQYQFFKETVEASSNYKRLLNKTSDAQNAEQVIRYLAQRIAHDFVVSPDESKIEQHLDTVIRDLRGDAHDFLARIWLTGIRPKEDMIQVSDRLLFRKPRYADMQERVSETNVHFQHAFHSGGWFACIVELLVSAHSPFEMQSAVDRLVVALRLFKLGAVSASRIDMSGKSFSPFANVRLGGSSS
jgi:hypothetical protein